MMNAGIACQRFPWISPKIAAEITIAHAGFTFLSRPRRMIPLQSHSSKNGANTETEISVITIGPLSIISIAAFIASDISGSSMLTGSMTNAPATAMALTIRAMLSPLLPPKFWLSSAYPFSKPSFLRLFAEA